VKKDTEVKLFMQARHKGATQQVAAARAGISERTARRYEQVGKLPSEQKRPHTWRTRPNPFEEDWPWVVAELKRDPALQGTTLFALLCERQPQRYQSIQVRTLQRHIAQWKALHGPEQEVLFTFLAERYEHKSVMLTTNLVFSEWQRIFKDPMTTLAAIDRVVHHSVILDMMSVESYRAEVAGQHHLSEEAGSALLNRNN
jgi:IstB-like ATP binding protein